MRLALFVSILGGISGVLLLLSASPVAAQDEGDVEAARAAFEEAERHFDDGDFRAAEAAYMRSYELMGPAPTRPLILFNVARAIHRESSRPCEAIATYERMLAESEANAADLAEQRGQAQQYLGQLESRRDGCDQAEAPRPERGEAGDETATTGAGSAGTRTGSGGGDSGGGGGISPIGPIVAAGGGAVLITGLILGGVALGERGSVEDRCDTAAMTCPADAEGDADSVATQALVADILIFSGAAIAAAGLILTFVLTEGDDDANARVGGVCSGNGCMALVEGRFE